VVAPPTRALLKKLRGDDSAFKRQSEWKDLETVKPWI
jgi:hypothetical protein